MPASAFAPLSAWLRPVREVALVLAAGLFWALVMLSMAALLGMVALLVALTFSVFWVHDCWRRRGQPKRPPQ